MKRAYRLFSLASALVFLTGCTALDWKAVFGKAESVPEPQPVIPYFDTDALNEQITALEKSWSDPGKESEIESEINALLAAVDEAYSIYIRTELNYYADWKKKALYDFYFHTYEDYNVAADMVTWAIANGYKKSAYADLFEPYAPKDDLNYYLYNNLNRVAAYAKSNADASSELLDSYYDTAYDSKIDPDKTDLICAELYLETLKTNDTSQFLYDQYSRDYTVAQASQLYQKMKEQILPVYDQIYAEMTDSERLVMTSPLGQDPYDLLKTYAPKLSQPVAESAEKLISESLYIRAEGENCYNGSYTAPLPGSNSAMIYTYLDGTCYDLTGVVHEFGHFHSDWRDSTPVLLQHPCQDIAEVHSQGMEVLFTQFYGDIFGDRAEEYERAAMYNLLDAFVSGLAIGEFEYKVMQQIDTITPEETVALFRDITEECGLPVSLYQITHLYEQPGYYVSYGISALPALHLYVVLKEDKAKAQEMYDRLAEVSGISGEYRFCEAMQACGFPDFFAEDALVPVAEALRVLAGEESAAAA